MLWVIKNNNKHPKSTPASPCDIQNSIHQNIYGKSLAITSTEAQLSTTIIENPEMLKYQQDRQNSAQANSGPGSTGAESSAPKLNSVMNGESLEDIRKVGGCNGTLQTHIYLIWTLLSDTFSKHIIEVSCLKYRFI